MFFAATVNKLLYRYCYAQKGHLSSDSPMSDVSGDISSHRSTPNSNSNSQSRKSQYRPTRPRSGPYEKYKDECRKAVARGIVRQMKEDKRISSRCIGIVEKAKMLLDLKNLFFDCKC